MPYTDGLGAAIAAPRSSLAMLIAKARAKRAALPVKSPMVNIFRRGIVPVLKMPSVGPSVIPIAPTVITAQNIPFSASGGGPVSSGAPSPVMSTVPEEQAVDGGDAPAQAGMSPIIMLLLAGTAVAFLLKKKR
jgi:hypothetical protein